MGKNTGKICTRIYMARKTWDSFFCIGGVGIVAAEGETFYMSRQSSIKHGVDNSPPYIRIGSIELARKIKKFYRYN